MKTHNEYAEHMQLEGYKDCHLAKSIHGTGICLKARQTLTMGENDGPPNRWKYQGDGQKIAKEELLANIPLSHLIYGCEFEAKGKRFRVVPKEPMDNLIKFLDESEPGEPPSCYVSGGSERSGPSMANPYITPAQSHNG